MKKEVAKREIESLDYYLQNHTDDYSEESHTAMMMAVDALSSSEKSNKWIPVSEQPKNKMSCLVYGKMHFVPDHVDEKDWYYDYSIGYYKPKYGWTIRGDMEVLAWMPLPKPYDPQERSE